MGRKSTVAVLDESIVGEVNRLIRHGRTIDEILAALEPLGAEISRSAMGRYVKSARQSMEQYTKAQDVARIWIEKFGSEPTSDVSRLLPQMLEAVAHRTLDDMAESEEIKSPEEVRVMARALKDLSGAKRGNVDIEIKMREVRDAERKRLMEEQRLALDAMGSKGGVTEDTKQAIRAALGIG
ncbi:MAG: phage protein Gp27 family protein [Burkholderiaceae bacterium]